MNESRRDGKVSGGAFFYMLRSGQHLIYSKSLSSLVVFLSVIVQVYEIHMEILTGQNIELLAFCTVSCSLITSCVVLFISIR